MDLPQEINPLPGLPCHPSVSGSQGEIFRTQLRAILGRRPRESENHVPHDRHAGGAAGGESPGGPGPGGLDEEGLPTRKGVPMGIMVGPPPPWLLSDVLAREADFSPSAPTISSSTPPPPTGRTSGCSTSTTPCNLSVLRSIHMVIQNNGHAAGIPVGMCGEAASDDRLVPLLLAMGRTRFSMVPAQVGKVKHMVRSADFAALAPPGGRAAVPAGNRRGQGPAGQY